MNKAAVERKLVVVLFVLVLVAFSFAQRDTKKLEKLYTTYKSTEDKLALKTFSVAPVAIDSLGN